MKHFYAVLLLLCVLCGAATAEETLTPGTQTQRGFVNDNVLHSDIGDIHFSSYIPETYDGSVPYACSSPCRAGKDCISKAWPRIWSRISVRKPFMITSG